jgi:stearoyl-CoA desaturase (delta-9 desaturase)
MPSSSQPKTAPGVGIVLLLIHLGALLAFVPAFFSWSGVVLVVFLWWLTGGIGITLGYHRLLTHRGFKVPKPVEYAIAVLGMLALQGGPIDWVATHRKHHAFSDRDGDPHSILPGLPWAHVNWLYMDNPARLTDAERKRYAPDLIADPFYRALEPLSLVVQLAVAVAFFLIGGWSLVVWGVFVRLVVTYHCAWLVNSAAHAFGYRTYTTHDRSTNCWWVALLTFGEGWHNNHHAFPFSARHGLRWFEFDMTWLTIKFLRALRLAENVKIPTIEMMERLRRTQRPAA